MISKVQEYHVYCPHIPNQTPLSHLLSHLTVYKYILVTFVSLGMLEVWFTGQEYRRVRSLAYITTLLMLELHLPLPRRLSERLFLPYA